MVSDSYAVPASAASGAPGPPGLSAGTIDVHVGERLRQRRRSLRMSQGDLAARVGLTYQQIQKYEQGTNRVSASRLFEFARVLEVDIDWFFESLPGSHVRPAGDGGFPNADGDAHGFPYHSLRSPETSELVTLYYAIKKSTVRRRLLELVKVIGTIY